MNFVGHACRPIENVQIFLLMLIELFSQLELNDVPLTGHTGNLYF